MISGPFVLMFLLIGLFRLLRLTDSPALCAVIFGFFYFLKDFFFKYPLDSERVLPLLGSTIISTGLAYIWFWLLHRFDRGWRWWLVFVLGLGIIVL